MQTPYSRDGKWLWTGREWVAVPRGQEPEPAAPDTVLRLALRLTGLVLAAGAIVTVGVTIAHHL